VLKVVRQNQLTTASPKRHPIWQVLRVLKKWLNDNPDKFHWRADSISYPEADLQGCDKEFPEHDVLLLRYLFSVRPASAAVTPVSCRFFFCSSSKVRIAALSFLAAALTVWMRAL
jgi:hypothetical protein